MQPTRTTVEVFERAEEDFHLRIEPLTAVRGIQKHFESHEIAAIEAVSYGDLRVFAGRAVLESALKDMALITNWRELPKQQI